MQYYKLMIELDQHEDKNLSICKHYNAIYNTPAIQNDAHKKAEVGSLMYLFTAFMHLIIMIITIY